MFLCVSPCLWSILGSLPQLAWDKRLCCYCKKSTRKKLLLQHQHILIYNSIAKSQLFQSILLPNPQLLLATLVSRRGRARITTYRKGPRLSLQPPQVWTRPWRPGGGGCWLPVMTFSLLPLVSSTMMVTTPFSSPSYCTFKPVWSTML
jgi:hypothetical protein